MLPCVGTAIFAAPSRRKSLQYLQFALIRIRMAPDLNSAIRVIDAERRDGRAAIMVNSLRVFRRPCACGTVFPCDMVMQRRQRTSPKKPLNCYGFSAGWNWGYAA